ncbi:MAG TPA: hypothetical protein DIW17_04455 [Clostridiales bacterium]|nr:hypothetical protein [Clostridiales bacterium]
MYKKIHYAILTVLITAMLVTITGCGMTPSDKSKQAVQIDVFSTSTASTTAAGVYDNTWWGKILKEEAGVSLNILPTGDQAQEKLQALMAGGELPDIVIFNSTKDVQNAIRAELLTNLDEHLDKLPNVEKNASTAMQYYRDNISNDTGNLYAIPNEAGPAAFGAETNWGPYLRWDLYEKIGSPEIKTFDDYLPVLKQMQDAEPTNEDGKKTYGITLWKDWDNYSMFLGTELSPTIGKDCGDQLAQLPFLQVDFDTGETMNILDKDSEYINALKFYFEANQLGILDPDSLTQTYATAKDKLTEGRVFFSWWPWFNDTFNTVENTNADEPKGFALVVPENTKTLIAGENKIGATWPIAIGAETKNIDACLRYVDFMYSIDGLQLLFNGPEKETWKIDGSKPSLTDEAWKYIDDPNQELPEGGKWGDGYRILGFNGLTYAFINPDTGEPIHHTLWESTKQHNIEYQTKLQKDWTAATGYQTSVDYLKGNNLTLEMPLAKNLVAPMTDEISAKAAQIGDIVKSSSWKMVFAKDEAEFNSLYDEMMTKAEGLGLKDVYDSSLEGWNNAKKTAEEYQ